MSDEKHKDICALCGFESWLLDEDGLCPRCLDNPDIYDDDEDDHRELDDKLADLGQEFMAGMGEEVEGRESDE